MKRELTTLAWALCMLFTTNTATAQKVYDVADNGKIEGGISIILPQVSYMVEIPVSATKYKKGSALSQRDELIYQCELYGADYTKCTALLSNANDVYAEYDILKDSIRITPLSTPDYTKKFYINPKKRWFANQTLSFTYGTDGILTDANMSYENKSFDLVVKGLGGIMSIAGSFITGSKGNNKANKGHVIRNKAEKGHIKALDDIIIKIAALEENATDIDMYKERMAKLEKELTAEFAKQFYSVKASVKTSKIIIIPTSKSIETDKDNGKKQTITLPSDASPLSYNLFSLDKTTGKIIISNEPSVTADVIWYKNAEIGSPGKTTYALQFSLLPNRVQGKEHFTERPDNTTYMPYNVPAKTEVRLTKSNSEGSEILYQELQDMPQFGIVAYLNNPKNKKNIQYDPLTGAIKKIDFESKAISTDNVGAVTDLIEKGVKLSTPKTENEKIKEEVDRLDLLIQLKDKKEKLGIED